MYSKWVNAMMIHFCFPRVSKVHNYAGYCVVSADIYLPGNSCKYLCYYCVWCETKGTVFKQMEVACLNKAVLLELRMLKNGTSNKASPYSVLFCFARWQESGQLVLSELMGICIASDHIFYKSTFCAKLCEISFAIIVKIVFGSQVA